MFDNVIITLFKISITSPCAVLLSRGLSLVIIIKHNDTWLLDLRTLTCLLLVDHAELFFFIFKRHSSASGSGLTLYGSIKSHHKVTNVDMKTFLHTHSGGACLFGGNLECLWWVPEKLCIQWQNRHHFLCIQQWLHGGESTWWRHS